MSEIFSRIDNVKKVYLSMQEDLEELGGQIDSLLIGYLKELPDSIQKHIIQYPSYRIKEEQSVINNIFFRRSVRRTQDEDALFDLNDKIGTRIVLLSEDSVRVVTEFLMEQTQFWDVRVGRNLDKKLDNGFDYRAIHLYLIPKPGLLQKFSDKPKKYLSRYTCEVQIRTSLQHTLAEVQHSMTYKTPYSLKGELEEKLKEAYEKIKNVDDFLCDLFRSKGKYDVAVQKLFGDITNLYIHLHHGLREQAGESLQREKIKESDHRLNAIIFEIYEAEKVDVDEIFNVCQKHFRDIEYLINSKASLSKEPIIVFIAYLFYSKRHTLRRKWVLSEDVLEEVYHQLGAAFE